MPSIALNNLRCFCVCSRGKDPIGWKWMWISTPAKPKTSEFSGWSHLSPWKCTKLILLHSKVDRKADRACMETKSTESNNILKFPFYTYIYRKFQYVFLWNVIITENVENDRTLARNRSGHLRLWALYLSSSHSPKFSISLKFTNVPQGIKPLYFRLSVTFPLMMLSNQNIHFNWEDFF